MYSINFIRFMLVLSTFTLFLTTDNRLLADSSTQAQASVIINFINKNEQKFLGRHKKEITETTEATVEEMRELMPGLAEGITFNLLIIDRDLSIVNGVTGRTDRPDQIEISLSSIYAGGIDEAINDGLEAVLFHELHHSVRGWTIYGNKFGQGIDIAAINEGLADVFAELQVGYPHSKYDDVVDFDAWTQEILALPKNANYGEWMFDHPDGRQAIGYRTGAYLIKKAMASSDKDILELSKLSVKELYKLAGY